MAVELIRQVSTDTSFDVSVTKMEPFKIGGLVVNSPNETDSMKRVETLVYLNGTDLSYKETFCTYTDFYRSVHGLGDDFVFPANAKIVFRVISNSLVSSENTIEIIVRTGSDI